jgi:SAM-dependent methyltransferase
LVFVNPMFEDRDKAALQPDVRQLHRSRSAELSDARALDRSRRRAERWSYAIERWLKPQSRVLEVGAGDGALVELLLKHGHTPVALDPDAESCAYVASRFGVRTLAARIEEADLAAEGPFDAVFMLNLIEHLEDPGATLKQLHPALREGGIIGIETPNILRTKVGPRRMYSFPHNFYFSPDSLLCLVSAQGYEPVQWREFPLDMFHLIVRKREAAPSLAIKPPGSHARQVRLAIRNHHRAYYLRGQFLLRKVPVFRNWYLYGRYRDRLF